MWARHSFRNSDCAAGPYTLPMAVPSWLVLSDSADTAPLTSELLRLPPAATAVCTTNAVAATCWISRPVSPARSVEPAPVTLPAMLLELAMPLARTSAVPFMCIAAISIFCPASGLLGHDGVDRGLQGGDVALQVGGDGVPWAAWWRRRGRC